MCHEIKTKWYREQAGITCLSTAYCFILLICFTMNKTGKSNYCVKFCILCFSSVMLHNNSSQPFCVFLNLHINFDIVEVFVLYIYSCNIILFSALQ